MAKAFRSKGNIGFWSFTVRFRNLLTDSLSRYPYIPCDDARKGRKKKKDTTEHAVRICLNCWETRRCPFDPGLMVLARNGRTARMQMMHSPELKCLQLHLQSNSTTRKGRGCILAAVYFRTSSGMLFTSWFFLSSP